MKLTGLLVAVGMVLVGCSTGATNHKHTTPKVVKPSPKAPKHWVPKGKCKKLVSFKGKHSAVIIQQNCLRPGSTTVTVAILDLAPGGGKRAARESAAVIIKTLGYKPKLTILAVQKAGKIPVIIMLVTGRL